MLARFHPQETGFLSHSSNHSMQFLTEFEAAQHCGGRSSGLRSYNARLSPQRRGGGRAGGGGIMSSVLMGANQINLAINIVFNGGSIVNNQLNGLSMDASA
jgi:hypothetical protein